MKLLFHPPQFSSFGASLKRLPQIASVLLLYFASLSLVNGAVIITTNFHQTTLNQSATDALNGLIPTASATLYDGAVAGLVVSPSMLSNATATGTPSNNAIFWPAANNIEITYDLGTTLAPAERQLDLFSIWIANNDGQRNGYNGSLSISLDGITFTTIPGTSFNVDPSYNADNTGTFNQIIYTFAPGDVTNFRYLRLTSNNEASGNQPRYIELDAFISVIPEPHSFALLAASLLIIVVYGRRRAFHSFRS